MLLTLRIVSPHPPSGFCVRASHSSPSRDVALMACRSRGNGATVIQAQSDHGRRRGKRTARQLAFPVSLRIAALEQSLDEIVQCRVEGGRLQVRSSKRSRASRIGFSIVLEHRHVRFDLRGDLAMARLERGPGTAHEDRFTGSDDRAKAARSRCIRNRACRPANCRRTRPGWSRVCR